MACPVCRARVEDGPQCRRCRADLSLLFALEGQRERALASARRRLAAGGLAEALAAARAVAALRPGEDVSRLLAVAYLLRRDFARAWHYYTAVHERPAKPPSRDGV
jgi:hypothetical protein